MRRGCLWLMIAWALTLVIGLFGGSIIMAAQGFASRVFDQASSDVVGSSLLEASFVDRVLEAAASPAGKIGQVFYDESLLTGIDDAFILALFQHESSFGTQGIARHTHSIGNIRCAGYSTCYQGFRLYQTWSEGVRDVYHLLATEYLPYGLVTPEQILLKYAPVGDGNDPHGYAADVEASMQIWHAGQLGMEGGERV